MKIEELPLEMLMNIFSYLPEFQSVGLVSHRFYYAVSTLNEHKKRLMVLPSVQSMDEQEFYQSIMNTKRNIKNILISFMTTERRTVIDILKQFSATVKNLRVCGDNEFDLMEAVSLVPNANHLELELLRSENHSTKKARHEIGNNDEELDLHLLKILNIKRSVHDFVIVFNRLPADVLIELTLHQYHLFYLTNLFKNQRKIRKLTIVGGDYNFYDEFIGADIFDNLKIEYFEWEADMFHFKLHYLLAKQLNLKTLKLTSGFVNDNVLDVITTKLTKLETLDIRITFIRIDILQNITKMTNLKELTLQSSHPNDVTQFKAFAKLKHSRITSLNIVFTYNISDDLIRAIAKSVPNLKTIYIHCENNVDTIHAIMKYFNHVEVLKLDTLGRNFGFEASKQKGSKTSMIKGGLANDNLIELTILYPLSFTQAFVKKLAKDYPRLKKLIMRPKSRNLDKQFEIILKDFKELESLTIFLDPEAMGPRVYDLDLLVEYKNNLKFVALLDMKIQSLETQIGENVMKRFEFIKYSEEDGLKLAISRKIMEIEEKYIASF